MRVEFDDGSFKYVCEWCKHSFSRDGGDHLSLVIGARSGVASDPRKGDNPLPGWRMTRFLRPQRLHFCMPTDESSCMGAFIRATLSREKPELPDYVL